MSKTFQRIILDFVMASLNALQWGKLGRDLQRRPKTFGYSQNLWDGKLLAYHLQSQYGIEIGVRQCQRIFHKFGFHRRKPRPVIAQADSSAQKAFKKTSQAGKRQDD